jgi:hypothetical protein
LNKDASQPLLREVVLFTVLDFSARTTAAAVRGSYDRAAHVSEEQPSLA